MIANSSIQWGDAGTWAAAAGTVAAVIAALLLPWRARVRSAADAGLRDLDDTRMLLTIALTARTDELTPELLGTHALVNHSKLMSWDEARKLTAARRGGDPRASNRLAELIDEITRKLDGKV